MTERDAVCSTLNVRRFQADDFVVYRRWYACTSACRRTCQSGSSPECRPIVDSNRVPPTH